MTLIEIVFICGFAVYAFVMIVAIRREREKTKESNSFIEYVSGLVEPREKIILSKGSFSFIGVEQTTSGNFKRGGNVNDF